MSVPFTDRLSYIQIPVPEKADTPPASQHSPNINPSDDELLERLLDSVSDSLALLFNRYYRLVWTIGMRILRDESAADDLAQDVFLYIFQKSQLFDASKGHARNWLVRVTYHRAFDRRDYLKARFSQDHERLTESGKHNGSWTGKPNSDFGEWICLKAYLEKGLKELSEEQPRTVRLHFYDAASVREVALLPWSAPQVEIRQEEFSHGR